MADKNLFLKIGGFDKTPKETFDNFLPDKHDSSQDRKKTSGLRDMVFSWAMDELTPILALFGSVGVGKTHMLRASANYLASEGKKFKFLDSQTFSRAMFNFDNSDQKREGLSPNEMKSECYDVPYLIFDEIYFCIHPLKLR